MVQTDRYPMCKDQPAQIDCRETDCRYHVGCNCTNTSPAITIGNGMFHCWSKAKIKEGDVYKSMFHMLMNFLINLWRLFHRR